MCLVEQDVAMASDTQVLMTRLIQAAKRAALCVKWFDVGTKRFLSLFVGFAVEYKCVAIIKAPKSKLDRTC